LHLTQEEISNIVKKRTLVNELTNEALVFFCEYANTKYRAGYPIVSDQDYDFI